MSDNIRFRIGGLLAICAAVAAGWWFIWQPWQAALAHAPEVRYSLKALVFVPFSAIVGLFFLATGDRVPTRNAAERKLTGAGWALWIIAAALSGLIFWWLKAQFAALGYTG